MFVFLFLFLFRQTKDKADQGDEYLAVFVQLELSDTSYFAELVERNRFLTDHIFEGVGRSFKTTGTRTGKPRWSGSFIAMLTSGFPTL